MDREEELKRLKELGPKDFGVVYGRRMGKTRLIKEWLKGERHVYFRSSPHTRSI